MHSIKRKVPRRPDPSHKRYITTICKNHGITLSDVFMTDYSITYYFETAEDKMMFTLKWGYV